VLGGRLLERAAQVVRRRAGGAAGRRVAGGRPQHGHPLLVAGGRKAQEVPGHRLALGASHGQQPGRAGVQRLSLQRWDLLVDRTAHERVHEVESLAGREHVDGHERVGALRRRGLVHAGERRRLLEERAGTKDGHRTGDGERLGRELPQPPANGAPDALSPELGHPGRFLGRATDLPGDQLVDQLAEQERVASGGAVARRREPLDRVW